MAMAGPEPDDCVPEDDQPPPAEPDRRIDWRLDPIETLSDWKIEISTPPQVSSDETVLSPSVVTVYHVHRIMMAVGSRKSEYFARLFKGNFAESNDGISKIELHPLAADAFPDMLDYMYSNTTTPLTIKTETAVALHHLAQYFEIRRICWEAKDFIQKEISLENFRRFYDEASIFCDDKLLNIVASFCAEKIQLIKEADVDCTKPEFWLRVAKAKAKGLDFGCKSQCYSILVGSVCRSCPNTEATLFEQLTSQHSIPLVDVKAVEDLLAAEAEIIKPDRTHLTCLQNRCAKVLAESWDRSVYDDIVDKLQIVSPITAGEILRQSIPLARRQLHACQAELSRTKIALQSRPKQGHSGNQFFRIGDSVQGSPCS